jgi:hypothetical protein
VALKESDADSGKSENHASPDVIGEQPSCTQTSQDDDFAIFDSNADMDMDEAADEVSYAYDPENLTDAEAKLNDDLDNDIDIDYEATHNNDAESITCTQHSLTENAPDTRDENDFENSTAQNEKKPETLEEFREENKRQAEEIERLKRALRIMSGEEKAQTI